MGVDPVRKAFAPLSDGVIRVVEFESRHLTPRYVGWLNDPETVRYSEQRHRVHTMDSCHEYFLNQRQLPGYFLAIEEIKGKDACHIGNMGVAADPMNQTADLSIMIGEKSCRGKGMGLRAWVLVMDACLVDLGFRLVTGGTMETNSAMIHIFERCGMVIDGTLSTRFLWEGREVGLVAASTASRNMMA